MVVCDIPKSKADALETDVRQHLAASVWCIEARAEARLALMMPNAQADAVVVDVSGHAIGLLDRESAGSANELDLASVLMQPAVVTLLETAPIDCAYELLRERGVRTLPIVSGGRVVGRVDVPERAT